MSIHKKGVNQCFIWNQGIVINNTVIPNSFLIFPRWEHKDLIHKEK